MFLASGFVTLIMQLQVDCYNGYGFKPDGDTGPWEIYKHLFFLRFISVNISSALTDDMHVIKRKAKWLIALR